MTRDTSPTQNYDLPRPEKGASWAADWDTTVETLDEQLFETDNIKAYEDSAGTVILEDTVNGNQLELDDDVTMGDVASHLVADTNPHTTTLEQARSEDNQLSGPVDAGGNDLTNVGTADAEVLNNTSIATDGGHLETLVSNLSAGQSIWLKPETTYNISNTLTFDQSWFSLASMAFMSRQSSVIKPDGDFTAVDVSGTSSNDIGQFAIAGVAVDASNLTDATDAWTFDYAKRFHMFMPSVYNGNPRDAFHFGEQDTADRWSTATVREPFVADASRHSIYHGASSTCQIIMPTLFGGSTPLRIDDGIDVAYEIPNFGSGDDFIDIRAPSRNCRQVSLWNVHLDGPPNNQAVLVGESGANKLSGVGITDMPFTGVNSGGAVVKGQVESIHFDKCFWAQGGGAGTAIDVPSGTAVDTVHVSPQQHLSGDTFPVTDPDGKIWYGWDFGAGPNEFENVDGEIYHSALHLANGWFVRAPAGSDVFQVFDDSNNPQMTVSGSAVDVNGQTVKNPETTGSSTDPRADTTADDYLKLEIDGTVHYVPLYT
jgi:hypothetical protein